uniref:uncharacterized protein LOC131131459 n=1 Tax=Doryrhamphus excisus TaxID=161450 RepID=UPI0025ADD5A9|nr:uncharacterized protein LOC131131459 [Doryrhamphus excisus]
MAMSQHTFTHSMHSFTRHVNVDGVESGSQGFKSSFMFLDQVEKTTLEYTPSHKKICLLLSKNTRKTLQGFLQSISVGFEETKLSCRPSRQSVCRLNCTPNNNNPTRQPALQPVSLTPDIAQIAHNSQEKSTHPPRAATQKSTTRGYRTYQQSIRPSIHRPPKHTQRSFPQATSIGPKITKLDVRPHLRSIPTQAYKNARGAQQVVFQTISLDFQKTKPKLPLHKQSTSPSRIHTQKTNKECISFEKSIRSLIHDDRHTTQDIPKPKAFVSQSRPHQQKKANPESRHNQQSIRPPLRKDARHNHQELSKGIQITRLDCSSRQSIRPIHRHDRDTRQAIVQPITLISDIIQQRSNTHQHGAHRPIDKHANQDTEAISMGLQINEIIYSTVPKHTRELGSHLTQIEYNPNQMRKRHTQAADPQPISTCLQITPL